MSQFIRICQTSKVLLKNQTITEFSIFIRKDITYLICKIKPKEKQVSFILQEENNQYLCIFIEYLNLHYFSKLKTLITKISKEYKGLSDQSQFQVAVYEIKCYSPINYRTYQLEKESYGNQVIIKVGQSSERAFFSNCFRQGGYYYYFLDYFEEKINQQQFGLITSLDYDKIYGINMKMNNIHFCLPFSQIISKTFGQRSIHPIVESIIKKVVYINYSSSTCTGTLISKNTILTVRHVFSGHNPQIGCIVKVRLYPYKMDQKAKLIQHGSDKLDFAVLQLIADKQKNQLQLSYIPLNQLEKNSCALGTKVYGMGFGKYEYFTHFFQQFNENEYLPTLSIGYISKKINYNDYPVYFKTSLNLFNGFSGCGIWQQNQLLGMATFIIKNKSNEFKYGNHNFNLSYPFLTLKCLKNSKQSVSQSQQKFIKMIEQIKTRFQFKIVSKL